MRSPLHILVAYDFSKEARAALKTARDLVERAGGDLTVVHVRPLSDVRAAVVEERGDLLNSSAADRRKGMNDHYEKHLARTIRGSNETARLLRGDPAQELRREASRGYDLLVMGTHGRGRTGTFLVGSTVQKVLVLSKVPIVVVPTKHGK